MGFVPTAALMGIMLHKPLLRCTKWGHVTFMKGLLEQKYPRARNLAKLDETFGTASTQTFLSGFSFEICLKSLINLHWCAKVFNHLSFLYI